MVETLHSGANPDQARGFLILLHGRGASPDHIMRVYSRIALPEIAAYAPGPPGGVWYPYPFMTPLERNQPDLDQALASIAGLYDELIARGAPPERIAILGFSQGACLTAEFALRHPQRYGGVMILTGGYIGPAGQERDDKGSFDATPVFVGVQDPDPHIPLARARETANLFERLGARVDFRRYPGEPHAVNDDEVAACRALLEQMVQR